MEGIKKWGDLPVHYWLVLHGDTFYVTIDSTTTNFDHPFSEISSDLLKNISCTSRKKLSCGIQKMRLVAFKRRTTNLTPLVTLTGIVSLEHHQYNKHPWPPPVRHQ
jgi:hypothetical protein